MKKQKNKKWRWLALLGSLCAVGLLAAVALHRPKPQPLVLDADCPMMEQLARIEGGQRRIGREEQEFLRHYIADWLPTSATPKQAGQALRAAAGYINAAFYLGSRMELCQPFTLSNFQKQMENENEQRARMSQTGEVYFGPDSFSLDSYFSYRYSLLMTDLSTWIIEHRDEALLEAARTFYNDNQAAFRELIWVDYRVTENGTTTDCRVRQEEFRAMGQTEEDLMDLLGVLPVGESGTLRDGSIVTKTHEEYRLLEFESHEEYIVRTYLASGALGELIETIAANNPVAIS